MQKYDTIIDNTTVLKFLIHMNQITDAFGSFIKVTVKVMNTIMVFTFCKRYVIKLHELRYVIKLHELQYFSYFPGNVVTFHAYLGP